MQRVQETHWLARCKWSAVPSWPFARFASCYPRRLGKGRLREPCSRLQRGKGWKDMKSHEKSRPKKESKVKALYLYLYILDYIELHVHQSHLFKSQGEITAPGCGRGQARREIRTFFMTGTDCCRLSAFPPQPWVKTCENLMDPSITILRSQWYRWYPLVIQPLGPSSLRRKHGVFMECLGTQLFRALSNLEHQIIPNPTLISLRRQVGEPTVMFDDMCVKSVNSFLVACCPAEWMMIMMIVKLMMLLHAFGTGSNYQSRRQPWVVTIGQYHPTTTDMCIRMDVSSPIAVNVQAGSSRGNGCVIVFVASLSSAVAGNCWLLKRKHKTSV